MLGLGIGEALSLALIVSPHLLGGSASARRVLHAAGIGPVEDHNRRGSTNGVVVLGFVPPLLAL